MLAAHVARHRAAAQQTGEVTGARTVKRGSITSHATRLRSAVRADHRAPGPSRERRRQILVQDAAQAMSVGGDHDHVAAERAGTVGHRLEVLAVQDL